MLNGDDCAPGDAETWTAPAQITGLALGKGGEFEFTWNQPLSAGGAVYDLLRSVDDTDWWNATCVASGIPSPGVPAGWDLDPLPGEIFYYVVRARSECGTTSLGESSNASPRHGTACE